jgi:hypothetical protein
MDSSKINDWLQVVGLFGVIGSLLFVGLQMKQEHEIALSQIYQARSDTTVEQLRGLADNPIMLSAIAKRRRGDPDSLTVEEQLAMAFNGQAALMIYEAIHYQYQNGFIDEEHWSRTKTKIKNALVVSNLRPVFESSRDEWRDSFAVILDGLIAEIDAESGQ